MQPFPSNLVASILLPWQFLDYTCTIFLTNISFVQVHLLFSCSAIEGWNVTHTTTPKTKANMYPPYFCLRTWEFMTVHDKSFLLPYTHPFPITLWRALQNSMCFLSSHLPTSTSWVGICCHMWGDLKIVFFCACDAPYFRASHCLLGIKRLSLFLFAYS